MDQRATPAAAGGEPLGQHVHDRGKILARQRAVRPGAAQAVVQRRLGPVLRRDFGNDLLGQHVERLVRNGQPIEFAAADAVQQRRAFHQIVARLREQPALRQAADGVAGATNTLQKACDRTRRAELTHQIHIADVDTELQRRGRHQRFEFAALQALLRGQALFLRQASVMRGDRRLAQAIRQLARHTLGHASRVDEHQRGAMRLDQPHQLVVDLLPHVGGHHRFQRRLWHFKPQIAWALMAGIDNRDISGGLAVRCHPDQQVCDQIDRILRRRQADPHQALAAQRGQTFERQGQMRAALVRRHGVDFVDDDRARGRQHRTAGSGAEQDVEQLRGGDDDVRRAAAHAFPLAGRRVAGAHPGADFDIRQSALAQRLADAGERCLQVALDVVGQRLQRRDVDHLRGVCETACQPLADQPVDRRQERGEGLAGSGRGSNQGMAASLDRRPRLRLRRCRRGEAVGEPRRDGRVKQVCWVHGRTDR